jgi:hypothetical protein
MSDSTAGSPASPTLQSLARAGRSRFGGGWEAAKRVCFFVLLVLIMLVPLDMVDGVVLERAATKRQVEAEIGAQWGPAQTLSGPALVVPYETARVRSPGWRTNIGWSRTARRASASRWWSRAMCISRPTGS